MNIAVLFGIFFVLVMLSVPIGVSLGVATSVTMVFFSDISLTMIAQKAFTGLDSFTLLAIPFFMLAGNLMALGGIARRIVNMADALVAKLTGGLGMATIIGCMFFAAISGSGPATVTAMGSIMIPEMEKRGYDKGFATGLTATAGTIGVIIPPSIPFVIYAVAAGASVGDMFTAGLVPGILIGVALMLVCYIISKKRGYKGMTTDEAKEQPGLWSTFKDSFWALMAPVIILGGIYGSFFTPTEAAVVATVYSLVVGVFVYKELTWQIWIDALKATADLNGLTGLALGFSMAFASYLTIEQIPNKIAAAMMSAISADWMLLPDSDPRVPAGGHRDGHEPCPLRHRHDGRPGHRLCDSSLRRKPVRRRIGGRYEDRKNFQGRHSLYCRYAALPAADYLCGAHLHGAGQTL